MKNKYITIGTEEFELLPLSEITTSNKFISTHCPYMLSKTGNTHFTIPFVGMHNDNNIKIHPFQRKILRL